jgi:hypothetical protein
MNAIVRTPSKRTGGGQARSRALVRQPDQTPAWNQAAAPQVGITLVRGDSVRSPVAGRTRSRVRCEDVGDGSAAEGGGAHGLDGEGCGEQPLACTEDDRVDDESVLVDQSGLDERSSEPDAALREQVPA